MSEQNLEELRQGVLVEGDVFSNWLELEKALGFPPSGTSTNSKRARENLFRRYFSWQRLPSSNRIQITHVYADPLEKPRKSGKYCRLVEPLLFQIFRERAATTGNRITELVLSDKELFIELGMAAEGFTRRVDSSRFEHHEVFPYITLESEDNYCNSIAYRRLRTALHESLSAITNLGCIVWERSFLIMQEDKSFRLVDAYENVMILEATSELLRRWGYDNYGLVVVTGRQKEFKSIIQQMCAVEGLHFRSYKKVNRLLTSDRLLESSRHRVHAAGLRTELNMTVIASLFKTIEKDYAKQCAVYGEMPLQEVQRIVEEETDRPMPLIAGILAVRKSIIQHKLELRQEPENLQELSPPIHLLY